jgi:hypothetical protein
VRPNGADHQLAFCQKVHMRAEFSDVSKYSCTPLLRRTFNEGPLFRCVSRKGSVWGEGITEKVIWHVVKNSAPPAIKTSPLVSEVAVYQSNVPTESIERLNVPVPGSYLGLLFV